MDLNADDAPKLKVVFPTKPGTDLMVAVPMVLPVGWKSSRGVEMAQLVVLPSISTQVMGSNPILGTASLKNAQQMMVSLV